MVVMFLLTTAPGDHQEEENAEATYWRRGPSSHLKAPVTKAVWGDLGQISQMPVY